MNISLIAPILAMDWQAVVGANIKRLRSARHASQEAIAFDASMDVGYFRKIEAGKRNPSLKKLVSICEALGAHPRELFRAARKKK